MGESNFAVLALRAFVRAMPRSTAFTRSSSHATSTRAGDSVPGAVMPYKQPEYHPAKSNVAACGRPQVIVSNASRYLIPAPVLNSTTVSLASIIPRLSNFLRAGRQAAPSGATKRPSAAPISPTARRSS